MGKAGKWIRNFLTGKKDKVLKESSDGKQVSAINPPPRERRRWSFRRSSAAVPARPEPHAPAATRAADPVREAAATRIQSVYRGHLARKALNALKGLVKLQALVRGHLVRKQAATTLRCMQALVAVQARTRAHRLQMAEELKFITHQRQFNHRKSMQENKLRASHQDFSRGHQEEYVKVVEVDQGESKQMTKPRNSYSNHTQNPRTSLKQERSRQASPLPSAITETSPRTCSNHFEDYSFDTTQSSPHCCSSIAKPDQSRIIPVSYPKSECAEPICNDCSFYPNYMANTESSKAKVRSHSAPKQRSLDTFERQTSRRRASLEGRNVPRAVRMQRSSSQIGSGPQNHLCPWPVKLDRSNVSLKESECGSNSTVLSHTNYSRSIMEFNVHGVGY